MDKVRLVAIPVICVLCFELIRSFVMACMKRRKDIATQIFCEVHEARMEEDHNCRILGTMDSSVLWKCGTVSEDIGEKVRYNLQEGSSLC